MQSNDNGSHATVRAKQQLALALRIRHPTPFPLFTSRLFPTSTTNNNVKPIRSLAAEAEAEQHKGAQGRRWGKVVPARPTWVEWLAVVVVVE